MAKPKGSKSTTTGDKSTPEKDSVLEPPDPVEQMLEGQGFIVKNGAFKDTVSLAPVTWSTIVSKILADPSVMHKISVDELNKVVGNIETPGHFGLGMTEQGTFHIQMPIRTQLFYDDRLADHFQTLGLQVLNTGPMICDGLKNQIED
jgi:hypothetical protein